jgi:hypothetical protein
MQDYPFTTTGRFSYKRHWGEGGKSFLLLTVIIVGGLTLALLPTALEPGANLIPPVFCILGILGMLLFSYACAEQRLSDIVIDEEGIGRFRAGKLRKKILWDEIEHVNFGKAVRVFYDPRAGAMSYMVIRKKKRYLPEGIAFDSTITNVRELLTLLNYYIRKHNILVKESRMYDAVPVASIPFPPHRGPS